MAICFQERGLIMSKQKSTSYFGKHKQEKDSVLNEDAQRASGGELHQKRRLYHSSKDATRGPGKVR
jgi:hypothetical protein